ncbi:MAG: PQQ-binding-like beta-propeller repeat protein [Deltaproteobacteria bacterium]|nr:PQQ-binding-like beta-propeller repeat protein [Deltaproteobacteria bacterium]MCB9788137.1 PQQ-binding-like beta-propeller repeat protein [Deltaproteobacteria bacterium]
MALSASLGACGVIQPIGDLPSQHLQTDWAVQLYELEQFAYRPIEGGRPLWLAGPQTPEGGLLVVPSADRRVRGIDASTGRVLWEMETRGPNVARPVAVGTDVLVGSMDGRLYRLHQRNGGLVWRSELIGRGDLTSEPALGGDRAFVTTTDNRITALSLADGKVLWDRARPHRGEFTITGQAGATVQGDNVITGFSDGQLIAMAASDGATAWSVDLAGERTEFVDVDTTPVVVGDTLVAAGYATGLHGIDASDGTVLWRVPGEAYGTPATLDQVVYVPQADGHIIAVDAADGAVLWRTTVSRGVPRTPAVTRRYVLAPVEKRMLVLDRGTGRVVLAYDDTYGFAATPEVAWGTAYAPGNGGWLYALAVY